MNPRIQELAYEAEDYADSIVDQGGEFHPAYTKKFAELIVAECVEVCAGIAAVRAGYNDADGRDTAYSCGDMIKEYFGVGE